MSALDTHRLAKERLAAKRALLDAGTPGPWEAHGDYGSITAPTGDVMHVQMWRETDARLTEAAVNNYGPLLDLAEGLLTEHGAEAAAYHAVCSSCARLWPCASVRPVLAWLDLEAAK